MGREGERRRNGWRELGMRRFCYRQSGEGGSERGKNNELCENERGFRSEFD